MFRFVSYALVFMAGMHASNHWRSLIDAFSAKLPISNSEITSLPAVFPLPRSNVRVDVVPEQRPAEQGPAAAPPRVAQRDHLEAALTQAEAHRADAQRADDRTLASVYEAMIRELQALRFRIDLLRGSNPPT